ncbi:MAG TPA: tRNA (cytidine(34)-2'-O)-methyltransferase [Gammaproteobacteria bacterium]
MFHVVLYQPEIPPNTGNIIRLCANSGAALHLLQPLGFRMEDRLLRRAGLDYREWAEVRQHAGLDAFLAAVRPARLLAATTRASQPYTALRYAAGDALLFGPESRGLPAELLARLPDAHRLRVPMVPGSRSLNLSNAVAVVLYEAWRQLDFAGGS